MQLLPEIFDREMKQITEYRDSNFINTQSFIELLFYGRNNSGKGILKIASVILL